MELNRKDIDQLDGRFRAQLINSLTGFKGIALCGTRNKEGNLNLSILSSVVHFGSNPPLYGIVFRPDTVQRDTLQNIRETGYFTLNHITEEFYIQAHQTSANYSSEVNEFEATGLEPLYAHDFFAPYVKESNIKIGLRLVREIPIPENGTTLVIGEIQFIIADEDYMAEDGFIDLSKAGTLTLAGLDAYHSTKKIARLTYAKTDRDVEPSQDFAKAPAKR